MSKPSRSLVRTLNCIAFFIADLQMGLGPLLAVYLISVLKWSPAQVGLMASIGGIFTLMMQIPMGGLVDSTPYKRYLILIAAIAISLSTVAIPFYPVFSVILVNTLIMGIAAAFLGPVTAALVLGTVGPKYYDKVFAGTQVFQHLGTVFYAGGLICIALYLPESGFNKADQPFFFLPVLGIGLIISVLLLQERQINHAWARGAKSADKSNMLTIRQLITSYPLVWKLALCLFLFHLGNAAMLFLITELLASGPHGHTSANAIVVASGSVLTAQGMMVIMAFLVSRYVTRYGRKFFLIIAFLALPVRGVLLSLTQDPSHIFIIQLLDGIGAGLLGAVIPIVVADTVKGSGHYNLALSFLLTAQGIGAALSQSLGGFIAATLGFNYAFFLLGCIAFIALLVLAIAMPETKHLSLTDRGEPEMSEKC